MKHKKLILFDIDGTLLYSRSTIFRERFIHAVKKVTGKETTINWDEVEGAVDNSFFMNAWKNADLPQEDLDQHLPRLHEEAFSYFASVVTESYKETKLDGAEELLNAVKEFAHLGVLTGNYEKIAWHKLELVNLRSYFEFGIFGHEASDRNELAKLVFAKAKKHFGVPFKPEDIIFIGDTPRDIACARTIQAPVISVATGKYTKEELAAYKPDLLVSSLRDPIVKDYITK